MGCTGAPSRSSRFELGTSVGWLVPGRVPRPQVVDHGAGEQDREERSPHQVDHLPQLDLRAATRRGGMRGERTAGGDYGGEDQAAAFPSLGASRSSLRAVDVSCSRLAVSSLTALRFFIISAPSIRSLYATIS